MALKWYVKSDDQTLGPFPFAELQRRVETGQLLPESQIRADATNWVLAGKMIRLFPAAAQNQAPPPVLLNKSPKAATRVTASKQTEQLDQETGALGKIIAHKRWLLTGMTAATTSLLIILLIVYGFSGTGSDSAGGTSDASNSDIVPVAQKKKPQPVTYEKTIKPLLKKYCISCHGPKKPKGELNLEMFKNEQSIQHANKTWTKLRNNLFTGEMPPKKAKLRPSAKEIELITGWIDDVLSRYDCSGDADPGRVTIRRLNRAEYNNTIRDLIGVDFKPADDFPNDDVGYGFDNIGDVLSMPPLLMEKYLIAAQKITDRAVLSVPNEKTYTRRIEAERMRASTSSGGVRYGMYTLSSQGEIATSIKIARPGTYKLSIVAAGDQAGTEPPRMEFRLDGKTIKTFDVKVRRDAAKAYPLQIKLDKGQHKLAVAFINDYYDPENKKKKGRDRNLHIDYLELHGPIGVTLKALPQTHKQLITSLPGKDKSLQQAAREVLEPLATRAFRRPVTKEELDRLVSLVELAKDNQDTFEAGIKLAMQAILVSPHFLFRVEMDQPDADPDTGHPITDYELATRLSYFIWASMPDEELFAHAKQGDLRKPEVLDAQVRRMLKDPKVWALVENFAGQWLQLRNLDRVSPDPAQFPNYNDQLRDAMIQETLLFFQEIVRKDKSVLELIDADFTFVNERLAKHYGIPNIKGEQYQRVSLANGRRGGILTHASVLTITSNPTRTSPVKRGKWVMETILGTPPPPPPPSANLLEESAEAQKSGNMRQRMAAHSRDPICASCHKLMDPIGFAFENYDAIGRWRDKDGKFDIDPAGKLPNGQAFDGPAQLKKILKGETGLFVKCLSDRMLTYALGRGLEYYDVCAVNDIVADMKRKDNRFSALVISIVKADAFQKRRAKRPEEVQGDTDE